MTDYIGMNGPDLLAELGVDAQKWAAAFCQIYENLPNQHIDEGWMISWFANAMMAMHDHLTGQTILNGDHAQYLIDNQTA